MKFRILLLMAVTMALSACGFEIVDSGNRGVERRFGKVVGKTLDEGLHFYNPMNASITEVNIREVNYKFTTESFTKDNQGVDMNVEFVWSIDPTSVGDLISNVGDEKQIELKRVRGNFEQALKDSVGKIDADILIQNRDKAAAGALDGVRKKFEGLGVLAHTVSITNLKFKRDYQAAVETKMIEKQKADKAIYETIRIKEQAKQITATATAEAEAMKIKSQALAQNKGLVEFEIAKKWDGKLPMYMFGNSVPLLNLKGIN